MFYALHTIWQMNLLLIGLATLAVVSWRWPKVGAGLVIFLAPLYLLKIGDWPMTVLEALIWVFAVVWIIKKIQSCCHSRESGNPGFCCPELVSGPGSRVKPGMTIIKLKENKLFRPIFLILVGVTVSAVFSLDLRVSAGIIKSWFLAPLLFAWVFNNLFESEDGVKTFLAALAASATGVALVAIVYLAFGRLTFDGRLAAFYLSPNHLAMWLAPGLISSLSLWFYAKKPYQRLLLFTVYCLLFVILYFTFSYGAWLGLAAAGFFILVVFWRLKLISWRRLFLVSGLLFIVFASLIFLQLSGGNNEKMISLLTSPRSSWQSRLMVWQSAWLILKDHWLLGIGPGLFQEHYLAYQQYFPPYLEWAVPQPHNLWLAWWLQAGLAGLIGFIWLLVIFFRQTILTVKHRFLPAPAVSPSLKEKEKERGWTLALATKQPLIIFSMAMMVYFLAHGLVDATFWKNDLALIWWAAIFLGCRAGRQAC